MWQGAARRAAWAIFGAEESASAGCGDPHKTWPLSMPPVVVMGYVTAVTPNLAVLVAPWSQWDEIGVDPLVLEAVEQLPSKSQQRSCAPQLRGRLIVHIVVPLDLVVVLARLVQDDADAADGGIGCAHCVRVKLRLTHHWVCHCPRHIAFQPSMKLSPRQQYCQMSLQTPTLGFGSRSFAWRTFA